MNQKIILIITESDYDNALIAMNALGLREDSYVADIILALHTTYWHDKQYKIEYLLETLLKSLFNQNLSTQELKERFILNKEALDLLIRTVDEIQNPMLKAEIIKIVIIAENSEYYPIIAAEGDRLITMLANNNGRLTPEYEQELIVLLNTFAVIGIKDYAEICFSIVRLSRNRDIAKLARDVVKGLLGP